MIVVGVDGCENSTRALRFADVEARQCDTKLSVIAAWEVPLPLYARGFVPVVHTEDIPDMRKAAAKQMEQVLEGDTSVLSELRVREGAPAAAVFADEAKDAELLVVGSRGHGGFAGLLPGSVSQQCGHDATCPVMIVPPPREA